MRIVSSPGVPSIVSSPAACAGAATTSATNVTAAANAVRVPPPASTGRKLTPRVPAGAGCRRLSSLVAKRQHQLADRARVAVGQAAVLALEQLDRVRHAELVELPGKRLRAEVEVPLVA